MTAQTALAEPQYELVRAGGTGGCELSRDGAVTRAVEPGERIMIIREDGRALMITGSDCTRAISGNVMLAPANTEQQNEVDFLRVFWGAFSSLEEPNGYRKIDLDVTVDGRNLKPAEGASYSFWLGMQPPLNFAGTSGGLSRDAWRKQNKWGNLAIRPTLQIGALGSFIRADDASFASTVPYLFNTFCDRGIASCPMDGPANVAPDGDGDTAFSQSATYTGADDIFPKSWVTVARDNGTSLVFVIPDASIKAIFGDVDYCATGSCLLPIGLLEQEIRAHQPLTGDELFDLFPRRVEVHVRALEQLNGADPIAWSFPKSFEVTGSVTGTKIILSLADLESYIDDLSTTDETTGVLRCLHAILSGLDQQQTGADNRTFTWTRQDKPAECTAN